MQVAQKFSAKNAQELPVASTPSSRMQAAAPQRPGCALSRFMHMGAAQSMLACQVHCNNPFRALLLIMLETASLFFDVIRVHVAPLPEQAC